MLPKNELSRRDFFRHPDFIDWLLTRLSLFALIFLAGYVTCEFRYNVGFFRQEIQYQKKQIEILEDYDWKVPSR